MPPKLETKECRTIDTFLKQIRIWSDANEGFPLWYRGMAAYSKPLRPSLYRHPTRYDYPALEDQVRLWFLQRGAPFGPGQLNDEWEELFYMQHYGFPTRLLDWSESPLIALYFAIRDPGIYKDLKRNYVDIWILSPVHWNRSSLGNNSVTILDTLSNYSRGYKADAGVIHQKLPAAIYGSHNSKRIAAQRGVFTVFGSSAVSMDEIFESEATFPEPALRRICIPIFALESMSKHLGSFGVTPSAVMQDLNSLASEIKELYKF